MSSRCAANLHLIHRIRVRVERTFPFRTVSLAVQAGILEQDVPSHVVLEELSKTITKVIVYPFIAFTINRTVENLAEKNVTKFHTPIGEVPFDEDEEGDG